MTSEGASVTPPTVGTIYSRKQFAKLINRSVATLKRWDANGTLKAKRYPSGRVFYTRQQLNKLLEE